MFIASDTDIGKKRSENQDRVHAEFLADNVAVAVVCDGMGGASSGGVASQLAIDAVVKRIKENFRKDMKPNSIRNLMLTSVHYANTIVYGKSKEDIDKNGKFRFLVPVCADGRVQIVQRGDIFLQWKKLFAVPGVFLLLRRRKGCPVHVRSPDIK